MHASGLSIILNSHFLSTGNHLQARSQPQDIVVPVMIAGTKYYLYNKGWQIFDSIVSDSLTLGDRHLHLGT